MADSMWRVNLINVGSFPDGPDEVGSWLFADKAVAEAQRDILSGVVG
jgi:hypothetical protein